MRLVLASFLLTGCVPGVSNGNSGSSGSTGGGGSSDSGTFDDSGSTGRTPSITNVAGSCSGSTCTWSVSADATIGTVELEMIETGDPSFESGCTDSVSSGGPVCGVWSEYHTFFTLTDSSGGEETKSIDLDLVDDFRDQVNNSSTLFGNDILETTLTVMIMITDADGNFADCEVGGENPSFFSRDCS
jgi:hypothetical protein